MSDQQWAPPASPVPNVPPAVAGNGFSRPASPQPQYAEAGAQPAANQVLAPPAPAPPVYGATYCRGCGNPINPQASICVSCGVPTGTYAAPLHPANPKTKSTSVVLAVFFGLFAWLYTYQKDSWKFWLNLALAVLTLGIWGIGAWIWAIIDTAVRPSNWYEAFPNG